MQKKRLLLTEKEDEKRGECYLEKRREFAEKLGVSRNLIWYWESDQKSPSEDSLKQLAELAKTVSKNSEKERLRFPVP